MSNLPRAVAKGDGSSEVISAKWYALSLGLLVALGCLVLFGKPSRLPADLRWLAGTRHSVAPAEVKHLEFREAVESELLVGVASSDRAADPRVEVDDWHADNGVSVTDHYLYAHDRAALERLVAGVSVPRGVEIRYERIFAQPDSKDQRDAWRTYLVKSEVAIDDHSIDSAVGTYDVNTNRPTVMIELTREGARVFGDLTSRIEGHKLVAIYGNDVLMAPVINGPIRGGRAQITMGGSDALEMERQRDDLVSSLRTTAGVNFAWEPVMARRIGSSLVLGVLAGVLAFGLLFVTKPERRREIVLEGSGGKLGRRIAWTGAGLVIYVVGTQLVIPGLDEVELYHVIRHGVTNASSVDTSQFSIFALGIMPIISSYFVVEVLASIVPPWRKARVTMRGRRRLDLAAAIGTAVVAIIQAHFVVRYFESLDLGGAEVWDPHLKIAAWAALATGPILLAVVASMMTRNGLGNGFVWLVVFGWLWAPPLDLVLGVPKAQVLVTLAIAAVIAFLVSRLAVWCIRSLGRATLPLPASGITPIADAGGLLTLFAQLSVLGVALPAWLSASRGFALGAVMLLATTLVWATVFSRPGRRRALLAPTESFDLPQWLRGVVLTAGILLAIYAIELVRWNLALPHYLDPMMLALATMLAIDLSREWRNRRALANAVPVWALHDPMLVEATHDHLADIPHFITMTSARSLYWLFAPYIPMQVHVPAEKAMEAHERLRSWLDS